MSVHTYPAYKNSNVPWLGLVPVHWNLSRFKKVFRQRDERSTDGAELLLSVSAYTGVTPRSNVINSEDYLTRSESLVGYKLVYPGDLVINIMLAWNRGLGVACQAGIVSPAYSVFEADEAILPRFAHYALRSDEYTNYFKAFSTGVIDSRLRIYPDVFLNLFFALPPFDEQIIISSFLDREIDKIDALIAEQELLIALLKEKRQAVISQAVAKGLDVNALMKNSGVHWLGEVPTHWSILQLVH